MCGVLFILFLVRNSPEAEQSVVTGARIRLTFFLLRPLFTFRLIKSSQLVFDGCLKFDFSYAATKLKKEDVNWNVNQWH